MKDHVFDVVPILIHLKVALLHILAIFSKQG